MIFTLPVPPSVNQLYRGRRFKTKRYMTWTRAVTNDLLQQLTSNYKPRDRKTVFPISCPVCVSIEVPRLDNRRTDIDNRIKAVADALVVSGILADDSYIAEVRAAWKVPRNDRDRLCYVEITELSAPEDWRRIGKRAPTTED